MDRPTFEKHHISCARLTLGFRQKVSMSFGAIRAVMIMTVSLYGTNIVYLVISVSWL